MKEKVVVSFGYLHKISTCAYPQIREEKKNLCWVKWDSIASVSLAQAVSCLSELILQRCSFWMKCFFMFILPLPHLCNDNSDCVEQQWVVEVVEFPM